MVGFCFIARHFTGKGLKLITRESIAFKEEMTMQNYLYAISDIHGMADLFKNSYRL